MHIPEEKVNLRLLEKNMNDIKKSFQRGKEKAVILQGENLGKVFTTSFIKGLFEENSDDLFDVRTAELGHLQNGGQPSPQVGKFFCFVIIWYHCCYIFFLDFVFVFVFFNTLILT